MQPDITGTKDSSEACVNLDVFSCARATELGRKRHKNRPKQRAGYATSSPFAKRPITAKGSSLPRLYIVGSEPTMRPRIHRGTAALWKRLISSLVYHLSITSRWQFDHIKDNCWNIISSPGKMVLNSVEVCRIQFWIVAVSSCTKNEPPRKRRFGPSMGQHSLNVIC
jgi:hypothetical protein